MRLFVSCFGLLSAGLITVVLANPRTESPGWHWPAQTKQVRVYQEEGDDEDDYDDDDYDDDDDFDDDDDE